MSELVVVVPVYNEEGAIADVLRKWSTALDALNVDYQIRAYNDGSKDGSLAVLKRAANESERIVVVDKPNAGHGPTVLQGYREACDAGADWIFQIDSDDEMGPEKFVDLWSRRADFDFLIGRREGRKQPFARKIMSAVSRWSVRTLFGKSVWDVNAPYRLMRVSAFRDLFAQIPPKTFAPNVLLSGAAAARRSRVFETFVPQRDRRTGEVSIKKWKLAKAAVESFAQTCAFASTTSARPYFIALTLLLLTLAVFRSPAIRGEERGNDACVYLTAAKVQVEANKTLYVDFFDHKGPVFHSINYWGYYWTRNEWGFWLIATAAFSFGILFLFNAAKTWFRPSVVFLWVATLAVLMKPQNTPDSLTLAANLWAFAFLLRIERRPRLAPLAIGALGAAIFFSKQTCVLFNVGLGAYFLYRTIEERKSRYFGYYALGWTAFSALVAASLWRLGIAKACWRDCFVFNYYYGAQFNGLFAKNLATVLTTTAPILVGSALGLAAFSRLKTRPNRFAATVVLFAATVALEFVVLSKGICYAYQFRNLSFELWIPTIGFLALLLDRFRSVKARTALILAFVVAVAVVRFGFGELMKRTFQTKANRDVAATASSNGSTEISSETTATPNSNVAPKSAPKFDPKFDLVATINSLPDAPLLVWGNDCYLYLKTNRRPPIPFYYSSPLQTPGFFSDVERERLLTRLEETRPLIVVDVLYFDEFVRIRPSEKTENPANATRTRDLRFLDAFRRQIAENFNVVEFRDNYCEERKIVGRIYFPKDWKNIPVFEKLAISASPANLAASEISETSETSANLAASASPDAADVSNAAADRK